MPTTKIPTRTCMVCHERGEIEIPDESMSRFELWQAGEGHIQNLLPELNAGQREQLMNGTHPKCWDDLWSDV
jgi:hypothetical protein